MTTKCFTTNSCSHKEGESVKATIEILYSEETLKFAGSTIDDLENHLNVFIPRDGYLEFYEPKKARMITYFYPLAWCEKHLDLGLEDWAYGQKEAGLADEINWSSEVEIDGTGLADTCKYLFDRIKNLPLEELLQVASTHTPFNSHALKFKPQQSSTKTYEWLNDRVHPLWVGKLDWACHVAARVHLTGSRYDEFLDYIRKTTGEQLKNVSKSWVAKAFNLTTPEVELSITGDYTNQLASIFLDFASNTDVSAKYLVLQAETGYLEPISDTFSALADLVR